MVDLDPRKLAILAAAGCEAVNPANDGDPVRRILDLTGGEGVQRVVEAVGLPQTFLQATQVAAAFGEVVFMGNLHGEFRMGEKEFSNILRRELTLHGTWNSKVVPRGADDWSTVLRHFGRAVPIGPIISDTPTLEEGPAIFASIRGRQAWHHKVIFRVSPDLC